jgi:hypothetical protein
MNNINYKNIINRLFLLLLNLISFDNNDDSNNNYFYTINDYNIKELLLIINKLICIKNNMYIKKLYFRLLLEKIKLDSRYICIPHYDFIINIMKNINSFNDYLYASMDLYNYMMTILLFNNIIFNVLYSSNSNNFTIHNKKTLFTLNIVSNTIIYLKYHNPIFKNIYNCDININLLKKKYKNRDKTISLHDKLLKQPTQNNIPISDNILSNPLINYNDYENKMYDYLNINKENIHKLNDTNDKEIYRIDTYKKTLLNLLSNRELINTYNN